MKIDFKQPKYIVPLIILPFLPLFFWVYSQNASGKTDIRAEQAGMQEQIGSASTDVQKKAFDDKLQAYSDQYKEADGMTAIGTIDEEGLAGVGGVPGSGEAYDAYRLDSIDRAMKSRFSGGGSLPSLGGSLSEERFRRMSLQDQQLSAAFSGLGKPAGGAEYPAPGYAGGLGLSGVTTYPATAAPAKEKDPMELFRAQMAYLDSVSKAADPDFKAERKRSEDLARAEALRKNQPKLTVFKETDVSGVFNTLMPGKNASFITAVIDEDVTGYAGSRIRLRLLEDIRVGKNLVVKGTYLYALISGFGDQRVTLQVSSVLQEGKILPVKLDIYDADGLPGLYVPESAFREFTKDLGGNSMQGVNLQGSGTGNQFLMSGIDKVFQTTSSAIASLIRKNKAKVKYNSYIYLIDPEALLEAQKNY